jgi:arsenate reductase (thioredoxin)
MGEGRAPSEAFQRYPEGEFNNMDTSLRWYDIIRFLQNRFTYFRLNKVQIRQFFGKKNHLLIRLILSAYVDKNIMLDTIFAFGSDLVFMVNRRQKMTTKIKVLFICQHNSGRSQIAEEYLKKFYGDYFEIASAGFDPAQEVNPLVVQVMNEVGIDLSRKKPQSVFEFFKQGKIYNHVITVCHDTESKCPVFPGITNRWHLPFPDPASVKGTEEEKLEEIRKIRDMIKEWLINPPADSINFKALIET